ncbi:MAG: AAA domain-containing protein, partial [Anaerolineales bacterium]
MYDSAERLDIALTPHITAVEKRVLNEVGIKSLPELAGLMDLPPQGSLDLQPVAAQKTRLDSLNNRWPVAPNLPFLVQRAKAALHHFDPHTDYRPYLIGAGFGAMPSDKDYPNLVKIFFDAQRDYLQDRVYMISALVTGLNGERVVVSCANQPPNDEMERNLLIDWIRKVTGALREVSTGEEAPVHLYCYNRYDQAVLLEALKRNLSTVASIPAFYDLLTQSPALTQPIISFLADEVQERLNFGRVCAPLHDVARWRGFDWQDDKYEYYSLFRARMFDNRRNVMRDEEGHLVSIKGQAQDIETKKITIEAACRFNSQIPLEYAYAAWNCLPHSKEDSHLLDTFRQVNLDMLTSFAAMRVRALAQIERSFKTKARNLNKRPLHLPALSHGVDSVNLGQSLREFVYMEHHTALQTNLLNYSMPIERRVQGGLAMLLKFVRISGSDLYQFHPEYSVLGLDPILSMNSCKLKEGDWVVLNPFEPNITGNRIKHGRLAIIEKIGKEEVVLQLLDFTFREGIFRYYHDKDLDPVANGLYTIDPMSDDLNADKVLDALANIDGNIFFNWLRETPRERESHPKLREFYKRFAELIDAFLKNRNRKLTQPQHEAIAEHFDKPLILVQGPPGTGKSYTLAWAIIARIAATAVQGKPCRVLISCKTHNAINVELQALSQALQQIKSFASDQFGGRGLRSLEIYKLVNDPGDTVPANVRALNVYKERLNLNSILQKSFVVFGATSGGAYNLMKYRDLGSNSIDWTNKTFDLVVIDEASQMSVPEGVLVGGFLKATGNMIVVGDHRQMPPIISHPWKDEQKRSAIEHKPYISLFETLVERGFPQVKLDESFRLHEQIAEFLRANVYAKDGINFHSRRKDLINQLPPLHPFINVVLDPHYPIVVIEHTEQASQQFNLLELELTRRLIEACVRYLSLDGKNGIGVVVPHRAQRALLRAEFPDLADVNSIDTVERFQGDERDVIIVSATASDPDYVRNEADFLLNLNRLNVAISRPRKKLIVLASKTVVDLLSSDLEVFEQSAIWKKLFLNYSQDFLFQDNINDYKVIVRGRSA